MAFRCLWFDGETSARASSRPQRHLVRSMVQFHNFELQSLEMSGSSGEAITWHFSKLVRRLSKQGLSLADAP